MGPVFMDQAIPFLWVPVGSMDETKAEKRKTVIFWHSMGFVFVDQAIERPFL